MDKIGENIQKHLIEEQKADGKTFEEWIKEMEKLWHNSDKVK